MKTGELQKAPALVAIYAWIFLKQRNDHQHGALWDFCASGCGAWLTSLSMLRSGCILLKIFPMFLSIYWGPPPMVFFSLWEL